MKMKITVTQCSAQSKLLRASFLRDYARRPAATAILASIFFVNRPFFKNSNVPPSALKRKQLSTAAAVTLLMRVQADKKSAMKKFSRLQRANM
jgi:hypothetical protein